MREVVAAWLRHRICGNFYQQLCQVSQLYPCSLVVSYQRPGKLPARIPHSENSSRACAITATRYALMTSGPQESLEDNRAVWGFPYTTSTAIRTGSSPVSEACNECNCLRCGENADVPFRVPVCCRVQHRSTWSNVDFDREKFGGVFDERLLHLRGRHRNFISTSAAEAK